MWVFYVYLVSLSIVVIMISGGFLNCEVMMMMSGMLGIIRNMFVSVESDLFF